MNTAYYYFMFALRRFTRATSQNPLGEFQAHVALLWAQGSVLTCFLFLALDSHLQSVNAYLLAAVVVVPLTVINMRVFPSKGDKWRFYNKKFLSISGSRRIMADVCAAIFFVFAIFVLPVLTKLWRTGTV